MSITKFLSTGIFTSFLLGSLTCLEFPTRQNSTEITDYKAVLIDRDSLVINFANGNNYYYVTQNIGLPLHGANGTRIRWISNKDSCITQNGIVCRPPNGSGADTVMLIAIISKGYENDVREFVLLVQENSNSQDVQIDKNTLKIIYAPEDSAGSVTRKIGLPDRGINGSRITWTTSDEHHISQYGYVSRPDTSEDDTTVLLQATISKGVFIDSAKFSLTVIKELGVLIDIDSNEYQLVKIGNQIWTGVNLRTTRFSDGTPIPHIEDDSAWAHLTTPGYSCFRNFCIANDEDGKLYNWYTVNSGKLAPPGWHIPTDAEWDTLQNHLIANGYNWDGTRTENKIAKAMTCQQYTGSGWHEGTITGTPGCDMSSNNSSCFRALAAGERYIDGSFGFNTYSGFWWSVTEFDSKNAYMRLISHAYENLIKEYNWKGCGFSIRLVKDK